jgi:uncharacterized membrane protein
LRKLSLRLFREGMTTTGEDLIRLSKAYSDLCEQRRSLLGFPSPGRRRDESAEKLATAANMPTEVEIVTTGPSHDDATTQRSSTPHDATTTPAAQPIQQAAARPSQPIQTSVTSVTSQPQAGSGHDAQVTTPDPSQPASQPGHSLVSRLSSLAVKACV